MESPNQLKNDDSGKEYFLETSKEESIFFKKATEYEDSFTVHGLSKIFKGSTVERIVWLIALVGGLACVGFVVNQLVGKYTSKQTFIAIRKEIVHKNYFPSLTICLERYERDTYCSAPVGSDLERFLNCNWKGKYPDTYINMFATFRYTTWRNRDFSVTCVGKEGCGQKEFNPSVIRTTNYSRATCVTWNYDGKYYNTGNKIQLKVKPLRRRKLPVNIEVIIHQHDDFPFIMDTGIIKLSSTLDYQIRIQKNHIKRLPAPFSSNCSKDLQKRIFPGKYSISSCLNTIKCMKALKLCNGTYDYCRDFIDEETYQKYRRNSSHDNAFLCLLNNPEKVIANVSDCQLPCEEINYDISTTSFNANMKKSSVTFSLENQHPNVLTHVLENELYSWESLLAESGGFIGLMAGMSVLSLVEIMIYGFLLIMHKCAKLLRSKRD